MLQRKHKGVLSLNLKKLPSHFDDLKIILILQNEMLLLMLFCKRVFSNKGKAYQDMVTLNNYFLGTVCSNIFRENCLFKNIFMHLSTKLARKEFFHLTSAFPSFR